MKFSLNYLSRFDFIGVLLLRLGTGSLIAYYGFPRFIGGPDVWKDTGEAMSLVGVESLHLFFGLASLMAQSFGGLLIIVGLFTRGIAAVLTIVMGFAVANALVAGDSVPHILVMTQLGLAFLALILIGPGRLSLDRRGI